MKILAVSDVHGDQGTIKRLAKRAVDENVDVVFLCGDLVGHDEQFTNMIGPFIKAGKKVFLLHGNHESLADIEALAEVYGAKVMHGNSVSYEGIGFFGVGGANIGPVMTSESDLFDKLKDGHERIKEYKKKVMITHVHPEGTLMQKLSDFVPPSRAVTRAINEFKPDILLCGHVHEAAGLEETLGSTKVINVAKEGKIIEL